MSKNHMLTLAQNYKVYCSLNNIAIDETIIENAPVDDVNMEMEVDDDDDEADPTAQDGEEAGEDWGGIDDDDEDMPVFFKELNDDSAKDIKTPSRNPKSRVGLVVRAKVEKVLATTGLADKRARMCDQNDFLKLLLGMFLPVANPLDLSMNIC